jgi:NAD(P)-dependent dehydrogenase (short-subunit alcohol dehydrogenase family)
MLATAQDGCIHTNHSGDRPMLLKDRVAIITGGAGINGLGFATARQMAAQGARVSILDLERADPAGAAARLGGRHLGLVADVTDKAACEAAAAAVLRAFGRIDALVNNAGITQAVGTLEIGGADYDRVLDVSLRGTLYMSQAVLPAMRTRRSGAIVCISSVSAQRGGGIFGGPHYSAAKAGVLGLARAMAREFGGDGIRVDSTGTPGPRRRCGRRLPVPGQRPGRLLHGRHARCERRNAHPLSLRQTGHGLHGRKNQAKETRPCKARFSAAPPSPHAPCCCRPWPGPRP